MKREDYLIRCVGVSLRRRLHLLVLAALLGGVAGVVGTGPGLGLLLGVLAAALSAVWIAAGSWRRHADDVLPRAATETAGHPQT